MTPLRQAFHAALLAAGLAGAAPAHADPLPPIGPPTAAEVAAAEALIALPAVPAAPPPAVAATAAPPPPAWLATRQASKPASGKSALPATGRLLGLLLVLGTLGGAVLYLKRRGKGAAPRVAAPQRLSVLSSTRIGPKAHAVVISVAGRQLLLGVTDSSVERLAFIDELEDEREEERGWEPGRRAPLAPRLAAQAVRAVAPEPAESRSFSELLKTAFKKREPAGEADAASVLAAETRDVVAGKPVASNVRMLDVEGQAQGLVRRLSGRA